MNVPESICGIRIAPVLSQIEENRRLYDENNGKPGYYWGTWYDLECGNTVLNVMPAGTSERRARAFMKVLDKKYGLIVGCHCGCRGDYEITSRGRHYLVVEVVDHE